VGSQVVFYSGLRMNSTVIKAVSDRSSTPADQSVRFSLNYGYFGGVYFEEVTASSGEFDL